MAPTDTGRWGIPEDVIYGTERIGLTGYGAEGAYSDIYLLYGPPPGSLDGDGCIDTDTGWHKVGSMEVPHGGDNATPFDSIRIEESYNNLDLLKELAYVFTSAETIAAAITEGSIAPASFDTGDQEAIRAAGIGIIAANSLGLGTIEFMTSYDDSDTGSSWDYRSYAYFTYGAPGVQDPEIDHDNILAHWSHDEFDSGVKKSQEWETHAWR